MLLSLVEFEFCWLFLVGYLFIDIPIRELSPETEKLIIRSN